MTPGFACHIEVRPFPREQKKMSLQIDWEASGSGLEGRLERLAAILHS
jgi:hypothetical protein